MPGVLLVAPPKLNPPVAGAGVEEPKLKPAAGVGVEVVAPVKLKPVEAGAGGAGFGCPPKLKEGVAEAVGAPKTPALLVVDVEPAPKIVPAVLAPNDGAADVEVAPKAGVVLEPNVEVELVDPKTFPEVEALGAVPNAGVGAAPNAGAAAGVVDPKLNPALGVAVEVPNDGAAELAVVSVFPKLNPVLELVAVDEAPNAGVLPAVELDPNEKPVVDAGGAATEVVVEPKLNPVVGALEVFDEPPNTFGAPVEVVDVAAPKLKPVLGAELVAAVAAEPKLNPELGAEVEVDPKAGAAGFADVAARLEEPKLKPLLADVPPTPGATAGEAVAVEDPKLKPVLGAEDVAGAAAADATVLLPKAGTVEFVLAPKLNPELGAEDWAADPKLNVGLVSGAEDEAVGAERAAAKLGSFGSVSEAG